MILEWINRKYETDLSEINLVEVKNFALVWNIFEGRICNTIFTIGEIEERLSHIELNILDFQPFISYFKDRYTINGGMKSCFDGLRFRFRENDKKEFVARTLLGTEISTRDYVFAITIIVYRLRNNLFHGLKQMPSIESQRDNFRNANEFLIKLIDKLDG